MEPEDLFIYVRAVGALVAIIVLVFLMAAGFFYTQDPLPRVTVERFVFLIFVLLGIGYVGEKLRNP